MKQVNILVTILGIFYSVYAMESPKKEQTVEYSHLKALPPELRAKAIVFTIIKGLQPIIGRRHLTTAHRALDPEEEPKFEINDKDISFIIKELKPIFSHKDFATSATISAVLSALATYYRGPVKNLALKIKEGFSELDYPEFHQAFQEWLKEQEGKENISSQSRL